jgi:DNA-binding Lrp family transcriptional regulator
MSVFTADEFYARLHRVMSLLDEDNIKILQTMKECGPRNLRSIARRSKLSYSTVYNRVSKLQTLSALRTWAHPSYSRIGLVRAMVLAEALPGKESLARNSLSIPGYWLRIIRSTGKPNGYYSLHAIPASNQQHFQQYLDQLVTRRLINDYEMFWLEDSFSPLPNFEYYDCKERNWRFEWKEWLKLIGSSRANETKKASQVPRRSYDKKDLIILKELAKDARVTLADLARLLGMTLPATKYRFDRLIEEGYVEDYVINVLPFMPEVSELCEVRLDFAESSFMKNSQEVLSTTPFVICVTPIRDLNSITIRVYIPRQEMNNLLGFLSTLTKNGILTAYSYLQLDPSTQQGQTFAYKLYEDGSGWHYDNREYLEAVSGLVSNWSQNRAEQVTGQVALPLPFQ